MNDTIRRFCLLTHSSSLDRKPQLALRQLHARKMLHTAVETSDSSLQANAPLSS